MRFDEYWPEDEQAQAAPTGEWPPPPDGRHAGEIVVAEERELSFKVSDANPSGNCLVVKVQIPKFQRVETIVPAQMRWLVETICRAASVNPPKRGEDWSPGQLVGRQVVVEVVNGVGKSGKPYVRVDKWHAGPAPLPEEVKRRPAAKPKPVTNGANHDDDIPF